MFLTTILIWIYIFFRPGPSNRQISRNLPATPRWRIAAAIANRVMAGHAPEAREAFEIAVQAAEARRVANAVTIIGEDHAANRREPAIPAEVEIDVIFEDHRPRAKHPWPCLRSRSF